MPSQLSGVPQSHPEVPLHERLRKQPETRGKWKILSCPQQDRILSTAAGFAVPALFAAEALQPCTLRGVCPWAANAISKQTGKEFVGKKEQTKGLLWKWFLIHFWNTNLQRVGGVRWIERRVWQGGLREKLGFSPDDRLLKMFSVSLRELSPVVEFSEPTKGRKIPSFPLKRKSGTVLWSSVDGDLPTHLQGLQCKHSLFLLVSSYYVLITTALYFSLNKANIWLIIKTAGLTEELARVLFNNRVVLYQRAQKRLLYILLFNTRSQDWERNIIGMILFFFFFLHLMHHKWRSGFVW